LCAGARFTVTPCGTPRTLAISAFHLRPRQYAAEPRLGRPGTASATRKRKPPGWRPSRRTRLVEAAVVRAEPSTRYRSPTPVRRRAAGGTSDSRLCRCRARNPPGPAPEFRARIAFEDSDPNDIADTLSRRHVVPLRQVRSADPHPGVAESGVGSGHMACTKCFVADLAPPARFAERPPPRLPCALVGQRADLPVEGRPSVFRSMKYCWISGRISSIRKRRLPDDRVVAQDRVVALEQVVDAEPGQCQQRSGGQPPPGVDPDGEARGGQREQTRCRRER